MASSATAEVQIATRCRAPIARTSSMMAAMSSRIATITCRISTGPLENSPMDFPADGAFPYKV